MSHRAVWILIAVVLLSCQSKEQSQQQAEEEGRMEMTVTSSAFEVGGRIPTRHTCDGEDISPPLTWTPGPEGTKSYALICDDPDAPKGIWVHWVFFNIPPELTVLPRDIPPLETMGYGAKQGKTDFHRIGYCGPCPPSGTHRYYFKLYALDTTLELEAGITKEQLLKAMEGHVLARGQLMGTYTAQ